MSNSADEPAGTTREVLGRPCALELPDAGPLARAASAQSLPERSLHPEASSTRATRPSPSRSTCRVWARATSRSTSPAAGSWCMARAHPRSTTRLTRRSTRLTGSFRYEAVLPVPVEEQTVTAGLSGCPAPPQRAGQPTNGRFRESSSRAMERRWMASGPSAIRRARAQT